MCTGIPTDQASEVMVCADCQAYQRGECRGRDPKVALHVTCAVLTLGVIFAAATMFF